jgi:hypothetical protein
MSYIIIITILIIIQPLGRSGQRPEVSQATRLAMVRCILGKFIGVVCHCFPPRLDIPTFATMCPHVHHDAGDTSGGRWNCGRECCPVILPQWRLPRHLRMCYMPQIYDMGQTALLPLRRKACWIFFALKIPKASVEFETANLGSKGQHAISRPLKPLLYIYIYIYIYLFKRTCRLHNVLETHYTIYSVINY